MTYTMAVDWSQHEKNETLGDSLMNSEKTESSFIQDVILVFVQNKFFDFKFTDKPTPNHATYRPSLFIPPRHVPCSDRAGSGIQDTSG